MSSTIFRFIYDRLTLLWSDILGLFAKPHQTLVNIADRSFSFFGILTLAIAILLGYPGFFIAPFFHGDEISATSLPSLPFGGLVIFLVCALGYGLFVKRQFRWKPLLRVCGYPVLPFVVWTVLTSIMFGVYGMPTSTGHTTSVDVVQVWMWSYIATAVLSIVLQVLTVSAGLKCSILEGIFVTITSMLAVNALLWGAFRMGFTFVRSANGGA